MVNYKTFNLKHYIVCVKISPPNRPNYFFGLCSKKNGLKWPKKVYNLKSSKILLKSVNCSKQMSIPPFLGDVGLMKVVSVFRFGRWKSHFFVPKSEHFCQKCPFSSPKKWHIGWPNESSETTFISQTSPKNGGIDICFEQLSLLSKILDDFKFQAFLGHFRPFFFEHGPKK